LAEFEFVAFHVDPATAKDDSFGFQAQTLLDG
jgi:hypothetical protein